MDNLLHLLQLIEQLNAGAADPDQALPALQAFYQHIAETVQLVAGDPAFELLVSETNQALQYAEEMINNTSKQVQKMERDQAAQPQEGEGINPELQSKMEEHQLKMQMAQQKAQLDMELKNAKFEQEQAMRDAENVLKMRESLS